VKDFIANTMLGIEYLWGHPVTLETREVVSAESARTAIPIPGPGAQQEEVPPKEIKWQRVRYTMQDRKLSKERIEETGG
jgi:stage V sporulation protein R